MSRILSPLRLPVPPSRLRVEEFKRNRLLHRLQPAVVVQFDCHPEQALASDGSGPSLPSLTSRSFRVFARALLLPAVAEKSRCQTVSLAGYRSLLQTPRKPLFLRFLADIS